MNGSLPKDSTWCLVRRSASTYFGRYDLAVGTAGATETVEPTPAPDGRVGDGSELSLHLRLRCRRLRTRHTGPTQAAAYK